jgi:hypothetical protein
MLSAIGFIPSVFAIFFRCELQVTHDPGGINVVARRSHPEDNILNIADFV